MSDARGTRNEPLCHRVESTTAWNKPAGFDDDAPVHIRAWGGGGGGCRDGQECGGGGGCYMEWKGRFIDLPASLPITIGDGGTGASADGAGGYGGDTTVGDLITAYGGGGAFPGQGGGGGGELGTGPIGTGGAWAAVIRIPMHKACSAAGVVPHGPWAQVAHSVAAGAAKGRKELIVRG